MEWSCPSTALTSSSRAACRGPPTLYNPYLGVHGRSGWGMLQVQLLVQVPAWRDSQKPMLGNIIVDCASSLVVFRINRATKQAQPSWDPHSESPWSQKHWDGQPSGICLSHFGDFLPPRTPGKSVLERRFKFQDLIQRMLITGAEASHQGAACSGGTSLAASSGRDKAQRHHLPKEVL